MFGVLGVSTAAYFPYCFFNLLSPVLDVVYGYLGFKVQTIPPADAGDRPAPTADGLDPRVPDVPAPVGD
jgi:NhaC family Na+:H+ antiporter